MPYVTPASTSRRWLSTPMAIVLIAASLLVPVTSVAAVEPTDMVLDWNQNAVAVIGDPAAANGLAHVPPLAVIELAMVHGAIYDAVNAIADTHEPYLDGLDAAPSASQAAATAAAAYRVLVGLTPTSATGVKARLDTLYANSLSEIPDGAAESAGIAVGQDAAAAMLAERNNDGRTGTSQFKSGSAPGQWRPVPPANANSFHWIGSAKPFTLNSPGQFRIAGPYLLTSAEYAAEYNEVKAIGSASATRTPEQAAVASWATPNVFPMINTGMRSIAAAQGLSNSEQARFFAMTSISAADSLIACWKNKDTFLSWRPQTAIRDTADDGNPATQPDQTWTSLAGNPGYPDHPSGFNCVVSGTMNAARAFFKTNSMEFSLTSVGATPVTRNYKQLSGPIKDAIDGRVYIGIHFRSADEQGAWLGKKVANWATKHFFQPVD